MSLSTTTDKNTHWANVREAGTLFGMRILFSLYQNLGRRAFSLVLVPVVIYFVVFRTYARKSSFEYLRQHHQYFPHLWNTTVNYKHVYTHFLRFAETILDKILAWNPDAIVEKFEVSSSDNFEKLISSPEGQLLIGAHIGNLEYCRSLIQKAKTKTINILVYEKHSSNFISMMDQANSESRLNIYQVDELDIPTILSFREKVDKGEWVFIAGDRVPVSGMDRTAEVNFLGKTAKLPIGPYFLAHALACPVNVIFSYRNHETKSIILDIEPFSEKIVLPRKSRDAELTSYAQQFSAHLERLCENAPFQWFNFYSFWSK